MKIDILEICHNPVKTQSQGVEILLCGKTLGSKGFIGGNFEGGFCWFFFGMGVWEGGWPPRGKGEFEGVVLKFFGWGI